MSIRSYAAGQIPATVCFRSPLDARAIKQALDLGDLARGRYGMRLRRSGRQWVSLCCFHSERFPSLYISRDKFHCFGCGVGGDSLRFVMLREHCDFSRALRIAAEFLNRPGGRRPREAGRFCRPTEGAEGGEAPSCRRSRQPLIARKLEPRPRPVGNLPPLECAAEAAWWREEQARRGAVLLETER